MEGYASSVPAVTQTNSAHHQHYPVLPVTCSDRIFGAAVSSFAVTLMAGACVLVLVLWVRGRRGGRCCCDSAGSSKSQPSTEYIELVQPGAGAGWEKIIGPNDSEPDDMWL